MTRLRLGDWLAAAGGVALLVSLFLPWYGFRAREETSSGFEAFAVIDALLVLLAGLALALVVLQATRDSPAMPVAAAVLSITCGLLGVLLVLYRLLNQPGPNEFVGVESGAWLGLVAAAAIVGGAWLALGTERVRGLPPGPEPELRPAPRIAGDAQA